MTPPLPDNSKFDCRSEILYLLVPAGNSVAIATAFRPDRASFGQALATELGKFRGPRKLFSRQRDVGPLRNREAFRIAIGSQIGTNFLDQGGARCVIQRRDVRSDRSAR